MWMTWLLRLKNICFTKCKCLFVVSCWKHHQVSGFKVLITYMFISGFGMPFLTIEATPSDHYDFFLGLCMVHFSEAALVFFNHLPKVSTQWMGDQKTDKYMVIYSLQNKLNDCKRLFFSSAFRFISNQAPYNKTTSFSPCFQCTFWAERSGHLPWP